MLSGGSMRADSGPRGFTLIEMAVTLAIFALLVAMAVPSMSRWVSNNKVRAAADALQNALRTAQVESLRRSRQVVFSLTTSADARSVNWALNTISAATGDAPPPGPTRR